LFIAEQVLKILTKDELAAAIAHEYGHMAAHDNLKRSMLRASRAALLIIPCGRSLDRAWGEASESAADEHAAQKSFSDGVGFGVGPGANSTTDSFRSTSRHAILCFFSWCRGNTWSKTRVRRLLELSASDPSLLGSRAPIFRVLPWLILILVVSVGLTIETRPHVLAAVHSLIEHVVVVLS
jgi:hypothetical protein